MNKDIQLLPCGANSRQADEMIKQLLDEGEGDIWIAGDFELIAFFADKNLIDEVVLNILPVVLGEGHRLSFGTPNSSWKLDELKKYDNDVVQIKYCAEKE